MTLLQNPVVPNSVSAIEIDAAILDIQYKLETNISWLTNGYGRAYRHLESSSGKSLYFPEIYIGDQDGKYGYYRVEPDNDKKGTCFFIVGRENPLEFDENEYNYLWWDVSIVFWANQKLINEALLATEVFRQNLVRDVREVLSRQLLGTGYKYQYQNTEYEFNQIYKEFSTQETRQMMMAPYTAFRVNGRVTLREDCPGAVLDRCTAINNNISENEILTCLLPTLDFSNPTVFNALSAQQKADLSAQLCP